jgi:purine-nucleoside phosphorylase
MINKVNATVAFLKDKGITEPETGIILGTGLGKMVNDIDIIAKLDYDEIPNFPIATVEFHSGHLIYGMLEGKKVLALQGRFHYYEGYELHEITFPVRVMKLLGIKNLIVSNAAGGLNPKIKKGSLMLLDDHINLLNGSPLRGKEYKQFGTRFVDLSCPYSPEINRLFKEAAKKHDIQLHEGIYVVLPGPQLETRAEYRFLRMIGADVVGMSTVPEVIVANQMKLPCAAVSVVTDECDPDNLKPVNIEEIIEVAGYAEKKLISLVKEVLKSI